MSRKILVLIRTPETQYEIDEQRLVNLGLYLRSLQIREVVYLDYLRSKNMDLIHCLARGLERIYFADDIMPVSRKVENAKIALETASRWNPRMQATVVIDSDPAFLRGLGSVDATIASSVFVPGDCALLTFEKPAKLHYDFIEAEYRNYASFDA